jgi:CRP-like cAMP-binding protein
MIIPLVAKLETVAVLSADDRQALEAIGGNTRSFDKGRDILSEGDAPTHVYAILDGWAARYKTLRDGTRQIIAFLIPGDLCDSEITVLKKMDHSVLALTPVTVASLPRDALMELTRDRPKLAQAFWWATLVDMAVLRAWLVNLGRRDAQARIAHQVCELHARMKRIGLARDGEFDLPITQEQLSDALGLTSVHVNRVLQRLRSEGMIRLQNRHLTLLDAERLGALAGFDPGYLHSASS